MLTKGFVDLLFILLCATIVMLSRSVQLGSLELAPARVGAAALSRVHAEDVRLVAVAADHLAEDGRRFADVGALIESLEPGQCVLLSPADAALPHRRVMAVWSSLDARGVDARLAAERGETGMASSEASEQPREH